MRVVVTGIAGLIGCHLGRQYLQAGHDVVGIDNLITGSRRNLSWLGEDERFEFIEHDITEPIKLSGEVDLVCNLACPASPVDFAPLALEIMNTCSRGTQNMLELARAKQALFLHSSTSEVYGYAEVHPQPETYWGNVNPTGPRAVYDEGKRYAEALITAYHRKYNMPVRVGRVFNTYGPRMRLDDGRVVVNFIRQALTGEPLTVYGDGAHTRSFCYVSDTAEGLAALADSDITDPVNIGNPDEVQIAQLAREVIELTGSSSSIVTEPLPPHDPKVRCPDISLARRALRWQPTVRRRDGLERTIAYCREALAEAGTL